MARARCSQLHVQHRLDRDQAGLEAALRAAEAAVRAELGYTVALKEKPLFEPDSVIPDAAVEDAEAVVGEKRARDEFSDFENDPLLDDALAEAEERM